MPKTGATYPWLVRSTAMVNHFYFYCVDRDFGPFFLKFCTYFPYNAKLCLNGHEYAQAATGQQGHRLRGAGQRHPVAATIPQRLQALCDGLSAEKIDALLRKWLRQLPHPFTAADRAAGYRYELSILQAEFSLTQVLDRPVTGRIFFEEVIRENLDIGRPDQVQLIFDRRVTRRTPGQFRTRVITEGVTPSLHVDYKNTRIKQYHKEGRALRTETTINDTRDFGIGKRLQQSARLRQIGFQANRRLLDVQTDLARLRDRRRRVSIRWSGPSRSMGSEPPPCASATRACRPCSPCWCCSVSNCGASPIRNCAALLAQLLGLDPAHYPVGRMTYDLRRLRLHGLIQRIPKSHRYEVTPAGLRIALFFSRTYARLLRPKLAQIMPVGPPGRLPSTGRL